MQVYYGALYDKGVTIDYDREILSLTDSEEIPIDWAPIHFAHERAATDKTRIALVLTGISGSSSSNYITSMVNDLSRKGFRTCVMNYRGYDMPMTKPGLIDFADPSDLRDVVQHIKHRYPNANLYIVSFSIGANLASKYCGVYKDQSMVDGLVSISNPIDVKTSSYEMHKWKNCIYGYWMTMKLKEIFLKKNYNMVSELAKIQNVELDYPFIMKAYSPVDFDKRFTTELLSPERGIKTVDDMYDAMSCKQDLKNITTPTLFINSRNDRVSLTSSIPKNLMVDKPNFMQVVLPRGGHTEFYIGGHCKKWCNRAATDY